MMMANPIAIVIAAIAALVAAFVYLWNTNEEFRQFWIRLWNEIKEVAVQVWTAVSQFLVPAWNGDPEYGGGCMEWHQGFLFRSVGWD